MKNAAAISAQLVDVRNVGQHKCVKLTLHVPAEQAGLVMAAFGWPTMVDPIPVAIARLDPNKIGAGPPREAVTENHGSPVAASRKPVAPDKRLAMRAGILCADPLFRKWLGEISNAANMTEEEAAGYVRSKCQVESRSEIKPGTEAAYRFAWIESAFICWRDKDKFVEAAE